MGQPKTEPVTVGCQVLPICDIAALGTKSESVEKEVQKRRKALSRMKELIRWAAAAKTGRGSIKALKVLYFRNKMVLKEHQADDAASSSSSKISFKWDVGSCSASSSAFSPLSLPSMRPKNMSSSTVTLQSSTSDASTLDSPKSEVCNRPGQWITSDTDFVVLELLRLTY